MLVEVHAPKVRWTGDGAARDACLKCLAEARRAADRWHRGKAEGLHDFRVSLRRLRTLLAAYRPHSSGAIRKRHLARLKIIKDATNSARDAEVVRAWCKREAAHLGPGGQAALRAIVVGTAKQKVSVRKLNAEFGEVAKALTKALSGNAAEEPGLHAVVVAALPGHVAALAHWLLRIRGPNQGSDAHRARIAGKKVRYLLEQLRETPRTARALLALSRLQETLGDIQDARLLEAALTKQTKRAKHAKGHPDIAAVSARLEAHSAAAFKRLEAAFLAVHAANLIHTIELGLVSPPPRGASKGRKAQPNAAR